MIRYVIFDLDGTLVDSCGICVSILSAMITDRGVDHVIDPVGARQYMSRGGRDMVAALLGPACIDPDEDLVDFRARYSSHVTPIDSLFPGVAESLKQLHGMGLELAICSNKPQGLCDRVLEDTGLAPYFRVVVGGQPGLQPKPAPDLLIAVSEALGCAPHECVYVGDSELDHDVAKTAGMAFCFLTYGYAEPLWVPEVGDSFDCFPSLTTAIAARALQDA
ncbi:HAD-IA family hydrolase [Sphingobium sp.]|uniref:HAD family hydrolase n=1 Tax=Sphingobium sp. TaxID=1912891 RepID=UPI002C370007|nr:HAD-IA family hydrolase [Sphingobium sp.]HUD91920.1 HAD-IA family hydrolase [Sphingobium sp.]